MWSIAAGGFHSADTCPSARAAIEGLLVEGPQKLVLPPFNQLGQELLARGIRAAGYRKLRRKLSAQNSRPRNGKADLQRAGMLTVIV